MLERNVIVVHCYGGDVSGIDRLRSALNEGWQIERADSPHMGGGNPYYMNGCLVYILYKLEAEVIGNGETTA